MWNTAQKWHLFSSSSGLYHIVQLEDYIVLKYFKLFIVYKVKWVIKAGNAAIVTSDTLSKCSYLLKKFNEDRFLGNILYNTAMLAFLGYFSTQLF